MREILDAMLAYASRNRPEDVPEIRRRIVNWELSQGPLRSFVDDDPTPTALATEERSE